MAIERIEPGTLEWEAYYANHLCRYNFANSLIGVNQFKKILDAACGVGYGSFILSSGGTRYVVGVDKSDDALEIGNKRFKNNQVEYLNDDCQTLNLVKNHGPFDCIVSFETLEHLHEPELFLNHCLDLLNDNGMLIISTPNQLVTSPDGQVSWEFHEHEYSPIAFTQMISKIGFRQIEIFGQQFSELGMLKNQFRQELNRLHSNPFIRMGKFIQRTFRNRTFPAILPEQLSDLVIQKYNDAEEMTNLGKEGPFVQIIVCKKQ